MLLLCHRNRISWLCVNQRRHQATTKIGRDYPRADTATECQAVMWISWHGPVLQSLWARQCEMLSPLTDLVGECGHTKATRTTKTKHTPWHWDDVHQTTFDNIQTAVVRDVVLAYPDYSQGFDIYTDSSKFQLGAVITQNNRPLAFFCCMNTAQKKISVTEKEVLTIVETLEEFKGMLWGQTITVYTDHKNLMQDALGLTSDRV